MNIQKNRTRAMNIENKLHRACCFLIIIVLSIFSCKRDRTKDTIRQTVAEWTGKEIIFPDGITCQFLNRDTFCIDPNNPTTYKILLYVDRINRLLSDQSFQFFLLDPDNKVVLIGNPAINPRIREIYKELISIKFEYNWNSRIINNREKKEDSLHIFQAWNYPPGLPTKKKGGSKGKELI